jgi:ParB/RepB/Spo0J family partition protein
MNAPLTVSPAPVREIPLTELHPSPTNPRRSFPETGLSEMAESVRQYGVLQPILVRPWPAAYADISATAAYEIVAGERRYRASILAGMPSIMATVRTLSDTEVLEVQILENLQREEVHPLEEAEGYQVLMLRTNYTAEDLAEKLGKSKAYIYARLKLCAITGQARQAFMEGQLSASVALLIARIPVPALQQKATEEVLRGWGGQPLTARQAADEIQRKYMLHLKEAPFPRGDTKLVDGAGKCAECPKRSGNDPIYQDLKSADICTDPNCWASKRAAHMERQKATAEAAGKRVIIGDEAKRVSPYGFSEYNQNLAGGLAYLDSIAIGTPTDKQGRTPTWRKLLGATCPAATTLIEDASKGTLHEAADVATLRAAATAAGITTAKVHGGSSSDEADRERERVAKEQTTRRRALLNQLLNISGDIPLGLVELRLLAASAWQHLDFETQRMGCRILGYDGKVEREHTQGVMSDIMTWSEGEIHGFLRLVTHANSIRVHAYASNPTYLPATLVEACGVWGVATPTTA